MIIVSSMVAVVMLLSYHHAFKNDYDYVPYVSMYMQKINTLAYLHVHMYVYLA